jgi:two-component system, NarL family, sensor histidine kinase DesK
MFASAEGRSFVRLPLNPRVGWVPYAWLVYLGNLYLEPLLGTGSLALWTATIVVTVVFLPLYFRSFWVTGRELVAIGALTSALGLALTPINTGASVILVYAAAMLARQRSTRDALVGVLAVVAVAALAAYLSAAPMYYWVTALVVTPFIGGISIHDTQVSLRDEKLRRAQEEVERLAAIAERERIARDLHDVLGHTLTLIVRKSELASRLAERDVPAARTEMLELESISRAALSDVRAAISGYRATWDDEVARAQRLLSSSGVVLEIGGRPPLRTRAEEEALALALREAVTNVARHAKATRVEVRWEHRDGGGELRVSDDGVGNVGREGNGLRGIRERVEGIGGTVQRQLRAVGVGSELRIALPSVAR